MSKAMMYGSVRGCCPNSVTDRRRNHKRWVKQQARCDVWQDQRAYRRQQAREDNMLRAKLMWAQEQT